MNIISNAKHIPKSFGERLESKIKEKGLSKQWIANKLGISKQALNYLINHSAKPKFVNELAEILKIDAAWLECGTIDLFYEDIQGLIHQEVPIFTPSSLTKYFTQGIIEEVSQVTYFKHPQIENIIALELLSDCLFPPIIENSTLFFDIKKAPSHGDFILFIFEETLLVRQFIVEGKNLTYYAPNSKYQSFANINANIKGTLIEARYSLKSKHPFNV